MMGQHSRMESVFCYFRPEEQIPEDHLLTADRPLCRFLLRTGAAEELLQPDRKTLD